MANLAIFEFAQKEVRFVGTPDKLEWIASDILFILYPEADKRNHANYLKKVRNKRKGHKKIMTPGGEQEVTTLLEPGLYYLIGRSSSPVAEPFQDWLYEDVIPTIRKTGKFELPQAEPAQPPTPTPSEISNVIDLILGGVGIDPKLVAGVKANALALQHPQLALTAETAKSVLSIEIESQLIAPKAIGEKLSSTTGETWSAIRVNKLLTEQGFQTKNPEGKNPSYLPTEKGKQYGQLVLDTAKGHDKTVQSLRWYKEVLEAIEL